MAFYNITQTGAQLQAILNDVDNIRQDTSHTATFNAGTLGAWIKYFLDTKQDKSTLEADVANKGFTKNTGTVTSVAIKMNGSTKGTITTSGTVDLGTVLTSHQDISGKMNKANPTGTGYFAMNLPSSATPGDYSFSAGYHSAAKGQYGIALGSNVSTDGNGIGIGHSCTVTASSIVIGYGNTSNIRSCMLGSHLQCNNMDEIAIGYNNLSHTGVGVANETLLSVGSYLGWLDDERRNAFEIFKDGHAIIEAMGTEDNAIATKKYVDDSVGHTGGGTVTSVSVKMNGSTKGTVTTSGTIDLGTVLTAHQNISGKLDKTGDSMTGLLTLKYGAENGGIQFGSYAKFYQPTANALYFNVNSKNYVMSDSAFFSTNALDLGVNGYKWKDLYLSGSLKDGTNTIAIADIASKSEIPDVSGKANLSGGNTFNGVQTINGALKVMDFGNPQLIIYDDDYGSKATITVHGSGNQVNYQFDTDGDSSVYSGTHSIATKEWVNNVIGTVLNTGF